MKSLTKNRSSHKARGLKLLGGVTVLAFLWTGPLSAAEQKSKERALGYSIGSLAVQSFAISGSLMLPKKYNPGHVFTSVAMMIPSYTPFYTEDYDAASLIVGMNVLAGSFNFVGYSLRENRRNDDGMQLLGTVLRGSAILLKIAAIATDLYYANRSVEKYNRRLKSRQAAAAQPVMLTVGSQNF